MSSYSVTARIALAACSNELHHSRALGCGWFEAYGNAYGVLDEIHEVIALADPAPVLTRFKAYPR